MVFPRTPIHVVSVHAGASMMKDGNRASRRKAAMLPRATSSFPRSHCGNHVPCIEKFGCVRLVRLLRLRLSVVVVLVGGCLFRGSFGVFVPLRPCIAALCGIRRYFVLGVHRGGCDFGFLR